MSHKRNHNIRLMSDRLYFQRVFLCWYCRNYNRLRAVGPNDRLRKTFLHNFHACWNPVFCQYDKFFITRDQFVSSKTYEKVIRVKWKVPGHLYSFGNHFTACYTNCYIYDYGRYFMNYITYLTPTLAGAWKFRIIAKSLLVCQLKDLYTVYLRVTKGQNFRNRSQYSK